MLDSTARAERIDLNSSEAEFFTWEVAQKPVAVRLPMTLVDRLESEAVENFRSLSSRGSEIGGLLLGSAVPGSPAVVTLSDFEFISCDYSRGGLYRLSDTDIERFAQAMQKYTGASGPRVVGYFRSHTRKGLSLDVEDVSFFDQRFPDPHQIVLLIRPFATKVSTAGIFIRENGQINRDASYREFPFRSADLASVRAPGEKSESAGQTAPATPPVAQPASPPKPQTRAQIVPIASRREITLPDPVISTPPPAPAEPPAPVPAKAPVAAPVAEKPVAIEKPVVEKPVAEKPVEKPVAEKSKVETPEKPTPAAHDREKEEKAAVVVPAPKPPAVAVSTSAVAEVEEAAPPKKSKALRLIVAAALGMAALVAGIFVYPMVKNRVAPAHVAPQDSSPLSLRVELTTGGMLLTWNRDLPVIQNASKVVLSISDGDRHENIALDPNQVRTGSILYPPITRDVSFQMEVTGVNQGKTTSESLRVIDPRPDPMSTSAPSPSPKDAAAPKPDAAPSPAPTAVDETKTADDAPVSKPPVNLKPFNSAPLAQRLRPVSPTDLPEAPPVVRASPASSSLPDFANQQAAPPPRPTAPAPAPTSTSTPPPVLPTGGQLIPAKVISRVDPEYPKLARQAGASGTVELEATISTDGRVKNPRVVHGNAMLQKAALDAVMQWRYKPATLNGKPVDSPVEIKLNFVAQGH